MMHFRSIVCIKAISFFNIPRGFLNINAITVSGDIFYIFWRFLVITVGAIVIFEYFVRI